MAGILIYKSRITRNHYSFVVTDDKLYGAVREDFLKNNLNQIIWEKGNVSLDQIEDSRKTKNDLIRRVNEEGAEVNFAIELEGFFE
jgi:hypothetical protein